MKLFEQHKGIILGLALILILAPVSATVVDVLLIISLLGALFILQSLIIFRKIKIDYFLKAFNISIILRLGFGLIIAKSILLSSDLSILKISEILDAFGTNLLENRIFGLIAIAVIILFNAVIIFKLSNSIKQLDNNYKIFNAVKLLQIEMYTILLLGIAICCAGIYVGTSYYSISLKDSIDIYLLLATGYILTSQITLIIGYASLGLIAKNCQPNTDLTHNTTMILGTILIILGLIPNMPIYILIAIGTVFIGIGFIHKQANRYMKTED